MSTPRPAPTPAAGAPLETAGLDTATLAVIAGLPDWWRHQAEQSGLTGKWADLTQAITAAAPAEILIPRAATNLVGLTAHDVGQRYVESLSSATRSAHGRHYTPSALASRLWDMTREALGFGVDAQLLPGLVRDPASGAGSLLLPVIREHLRASETADPGLVLQGISSLIEAGDQDPWAVYIANIVLAAEMLPTLARIPERLRRPLPALASVTDGLATAVRPARVTIMNPPYGRLRLSDTDRAQFQEVLYGHANIYAMFMAAGINNLETDGILAALVPTSFTAGLYFTKLRQFLSDKAPLKSVTFVEDRSGTFTGVIQETCLAVFSTKRSRRTDVARANGSFTPVATIPSPRGDRPWLVPRENADAELAAVANQMTNSLSLAGWHASTGPLVWNRRKEDLHARPGKDRVRVIWAADIDGGTIHRDKRRDHTRYLHTTGPRDLGVFTLAEPAVLVQRTTAPEQLRRLVPADLSPDTLTDLGGRVVIENHVNVLRPNTFTPQLTRAALSRVLATKTLDRLLRCVSGSVAVSSYELDSLPLPGADILATWELLEGDMLETAVRSAYQPGEVK